MDGRTILTTARLKLRAFRESDLPLYAAINADLEVMKYLGGVAMSREASDSDVRGAQNCFDTRGFGKIAVERISDSAFLGMCGPSREVWYPDDLEIGWRLGRAHWGFGYASEAASAWLDYAFTQLAAPRVISIADVPNARSIAVMRRIGLRFDHEAELAWDGGTFPAVIYALTDGEWSARR